MKRDVDSRRVPPPSVVLSLFAILAGCTPPDYPIPAQRKMPPGPEAIFPKTMLPMADDDSDVYILGDVERHSTSADGRWTGAHPRFKLWPDRADHWTFHLSFTIPESLSRQIGPQTIAIRIGDTVIDRPRFTEAKDHEYESPVPAGLIRAFEAVVIGLDIDPVYAAETDPVKRGVLLRSIGLIRTR